jgi:assimilatory nitrate reductase catalytic subunit
LFWQATLLSRTVPDHFPEGMLWSRAAGEGHWSFRLAGTEPVADWRRFAKAMLGDGTWIDYQDRKLGLYRTARLIEGQLEALLMVGPADSRPSAEWPADQSPRAGLLSGGRAIAPASPMVCACHGVTRQAILDAAARGETTRAGTGCGSCIPEVKNLLTPLAQRSAR